MESENDGKINAIDGCKMKAGFRVPEKVRHPGAFRVSMPSPGDIGRIRRRRRNPQSLRSFRKAGSINSTDYQQRSLFTVGNNHGKYG